MPEWKCKYMQEMQITHWSKSTLCDSFCYNLTNPEWMFNRITVILLCSRFCCLSGWFNHLQKVYLHTKSLYISFWSQSSGSWSNFSFVFWKKTYPKEQFISVLFMSQFCHSNVHAFPILQTLSQAMDSPKYSEPLCWCIWSGTLAFPVQCLSYSPTCSVCRRCRSLGLTNLKTVWEPGTIQMCILWNHIWRI